MRRLGINLAPAPSLTAPAEWLEKVRLADSLGVQSVWAAEPWGRDPLIFLSLVAEHTRRVQIGTSVLNCYSRTAAQMAQSFATLDELSGGRALIGLGASTAAVVEGWHGLPFQRPLARLREYARLIRLALRRERMAYRTPGLTVERGLALQMEPVRASIPIYFGTVGDAALRLTGEVADGWLPRYWPASALGRARSLIAEGARKAGRDPGAVTIAPITELFVARTPEERAQVQEAARRVVSFAVGRTGDFFPAMLSRLGYAQECAACRAAWARRDEAAAVAAVGDGMVADVCIVGDIEECCAALDERTRLGVDVSIIALPAGKSRDVGRLLEELLG